MSYSERYTAERNLIALTEENDMVNGTIKVFVDNLATSKYGVWELNYNLTNFNEKYFTDKSPDLTKYIPSVDDYYYFNDANGMKIYSYLKNDLSTVSQFSIPKVYASTSYIGTNKNFLASLNKLIIQVIEHTIDGVSDNVRQLYYIVDGGTMQKCIKIVDQFTDYTSMQNLSGILACHNIPTNITNSILFNFRVSIYSSGIPGAATSPFSVRQKKISGCPDIDG